MSKSKDAMPGSQRQVVKPLDSKTEAAIKDRATARTRRILFPNDTRTDKQVAKELRSAVRKFEADKKAGKLKPVSVRYRL